MANNSTQQIVNKAWNFAHVLRDDGLSYMAYTEQITFLLFLKMADEQTKLPGQRQASSRRGYDWGSAPEEGRRRARSPLPRTSGGTGRQPGMLGEIFKKARPEIQNPATLKRLIVDLIEPQDWLALEADVKGDIYEGLLAKSAAESPKGAGQYFTPRELIKAIVDVMQPTPEDTVCDPACGTGGFLLAAHDYVAKHYGKARPGPEEAPADGLRARRRARPGTARLCIMNLLPARHRRRSLPDPFGRGQPGGRPRATGTQPGADQSAVRQEELASPS